MTAATRVAVSSLVVLASVAFAAENAAQPPPPGRGPPPQAVEACKSLSAAAACAFKLGEQTVTGTCVERRSGSGLVCHPADGPGGAGGPPGRPGGPGGPGGHRGPPPEAVEACKALTAAAACAFKLGERSVTGTCGERRGGGGLVCRPDGGPGGLDGPPGGPGTQRGPPPAGPGGPGGGGEHRGPPPEALEACKALAADAPCSFVLGQRAVTGTCRTPPRGGPHACRPEHGPNGPPGRAQ